MRNAQISRKTAETDITLSLCLEGGEASADTGVGFLNHMLTLFAAHSGFGFQVSCKGDTDVDFHHTVEDIGICLGQAFAQALGDKRGIMRYGHIILPMDEALILVAADVSGRAHLSWDVPIPAQKVGDFDTELTEEFFTAFVRASGVTLHIKMLDGSNSHHIIEGIFKAFARTLKAAAAIDEKNADAVPSTKGIL